MAEKNALVIIKSRPFTNLNYYEALRTAAGLWEHDVSILWMGEGVYAALDKADKTITGKFLVDLPDLDIELYVDQESLEKKGYKESDLIEKAQIADGAKISELLESAEASFVF